MKKKISDHPLWRRWTQIKYMLTNENARQHHNYQNLPMVGFDDFWEFAEFVEREIGPLPSPDHRLARKNQRGGYVPGNIFWASNHVEVSQRFVDIYKFKVGRRKMTYREMSEQSGIGEHTIRSRISRGWTPKDAMMIPPQYGHKIYYGSL
jgi:hypothetical protein